MRRSRSEALWMPISGLLVFNILTGKKRAMTELKFIWLVNMTGHFTNIILSPAKTYFLPHKHGYVAQRNLHWPAGLSGVEWTILTYL